jgi:ABC-type uncharacterized transport system fused permease/ATPase subunit
VLSIAVTLVCRSIFRLKLLNLTTAVENGVMTGREKSFWDSVRLFSLYVIPTTALFASFNYLLSELAIRVRSNVTTRLLAKFTTDTVYYKMINARQLQSIIPNECMEHDSFNYPDQVLTTDIEHFSYALSGLFSHVMRPAVDILVNAQRLYSTGGALLPAVMGVYLVVTTNILNYFRGPVPGFIDKEQRLEGEYRTLVARIATSAEQVAALGGGKNEEHNVLQSMRPLLEYSRSFAQFRCTMSFVDAVVARYWLMLLGWRIIGTHFFCDQKQGLLHDKEALFRDYQNMSKTMLALSNAIGELIMSGRDVVKVFSYAEKLAEFEDAMDAWIARSEATSSSSSSSSFDHNSSLITGDDSATTREFYVADPRSSSGGGSSAGAGAEAGAGAGAGAAEEGQGRVPCDISKEDRSNCIVMEGVSITPPHSSAPLHTNMNIVFRR